VRAVQHGDSGRRARAGAHTRPGLGDRSWGLDERVTPQGARSALACVPWCRLSRASGHRLLEGTGRPSVASAGWYAGTHRPEMPGLPHTANATTVQSPARRGPQVVARAAGRARTGLGAGAAAVACVWVARGRRASRGRCRGRTGRRCHRGPARLGPSHAARRVPDGTSTSLHQGTQANAERAPAAYARQFQSPASIAESDAYERRPALAVQIPVLDVLTALPCRTDPAARVPMARALSRLRTVTAFILA